MAEMHDSNEPLSGTQDRPTLSVLSAPPPLPPVTSPLVIFFRWIFRMAFMVSLGVNLLLIVVLASMHLGDTGTGQLREQFHSGKAEARDKIAVIKVNGVIMEGMMGFAHKQIEEAVEDDNVKAIVLRVVSPGGSVTASDDLHKRLLDLHHGTTAGKKAPKKPIVVSMGALAASGGYYISMPSDLIVAERTSLTGSIGVIASFPNVSGLAKKYGFGMEVIKSGEVKDSGSMFRAMSPQERQLWQDMIDDMFAGFIDVVEKGRPNLKGKLTEIFVEKEIANPGNEADPKAKVKYVRRRADGGIFTAKDALAAGLIDKIGYLDDAIEEARKIAKLSEDVRVIEYEKPQTLIDVLTRSQAARPSGQFDLGKLSAAVAPRAWYLADQSDLAGIIAALGKE